MRMLLICRHSPYGSSLAREGLDLALAASVYELEISLLFSGEGVWQLLPEQQPDDGRPLSKPLSALPLYDISDIAVNAQSLTERGLSADMLLLSPTLINPGELGDYLAGFDRIMAW